MRAQSPKSPASPRPLHTDVAFGSDAPLDIEHDPHADSPFPSALNWSADDLADAVRMPLHQQVFAPSANDARLHRPRRRLHFLATASLPTRFRIGG